MQQAENSGIGDFEIENIDVFFFCRYFKYLTCLFVLFFRSELNDFYHYFYMLTNVLFYVSSTVNPILYNLVSANFRQIFVSTLSFLCPPWRRKKQHPGFSRKSNSISSTNHTFSTQVTRETPYWKQWDKSSSTSKTCLCVCYSTWASQRPPPFIPKGFLAHTCQNTVSKHLHSGKIILFLPKWLYSKWVLDRLKVHLAFQRSTWWWDPYNENLSLR